MSIITCGPLQDGVAFTTTEDRAKLKNLRRNPRCSLMVARENWSAYVVLQGTARLLSADTTDADGLRMALRDVYRTAAAAEHPNWEEYDQAMVDPAPVGHNSGAGPSIWRERIVEAPGTTTLTAPQ